MQFIRNINKRVLFTLAALLLLLMLSAQNVTLHIHSYEHDPIQSHHSIDQLIDHTHLSDAHLSIDSSHAVHHDGIASEVDACPDCLVNQLSLSLKSIAVLTVVLLLLLPLLSKTVFLRIENTPPFLRRRYLSPALRAPPC